ncbi:unnamed protein product [Cuscuta epithymum]|uniref:Time for coffee n=1 Tax=Cuscuta epithymum TaxID=186058 RepID=A0AAV0FM62_9ASTE|nr:unnamed protein product [Cuscuta epithymum]
MERNREGRRASLVAAPNGLSRRRHRPNSLRDSPDEDGPAEFSESVRLRERVKKDRDRDRERDRERERSSRSKRRRGGDRLIHGSDRGDDSSAESNYDEECEDDDGNHQHQSNGGGGARSLPPNPLTAAAAASFPNHHHPSSNTVNHHQQNHLQHRKTYPPNSTNVLRTSPVWKSGDEMIGGISVPRKARSAHTKRSHDWVSCNSGAAAAAANGGAAGGDQNHRQASNSPVRHGHALSPAHPLSPTSSNASGRKKIANNGTKQRPPKSSSSKSTSSNREELEIEIAEVLYGLMTQSQAPPPPKKEVAATNDSREVANNRSGGGCGGDAADSNTQSPAILPMSSNSPSAPFSAIAPKRKRPRQVLEPQSSPSIRSSPSSASTKSQIDQTMAMKAEASSPNSEKTAVENNGGSLYSYASQGKTLSLDPVPESMAVVKSETRPAAGELSSREDPGGVGKVEEATILPNKESAVAVTAEDNNCDDSTSTVPAATTYKPSDRSEAENHTEKIQIDLMLRPSSEGEGEGEVNFCSTTVDHKRGASNSINPEMKLDDGELGKIDAQSVEAEEKKGSAEVEVVSDKKTVDAKGRDIDLQLDLEKREWDSGSAINRSQQPTQKQQPPSLPPPSARTNKEQSNMVVEKSSQSGSLPLPMSMASWSGGLPPLGYMAPLQGVLAMDGSTIPSTPLQPVFTQPRPKRCATHCYIARNIHLLQQFMKMNPFWPPAPTPSSLFGSNACNLNVVPATEFNGNIVGRGGSTGGLDKGPGLAIFPGFGSKDKGSQAPNIPDPVHRKQQQQQQILLQQPLPPPAAPNSLLPGHTYIIPLSQQQAGPRPGASKSPVAATGAQHALSNVTNSAAGGSNASATAAGGTHAAVSFSYPNVPPNETPYLAILQNNGYFQIPAVGAPLNYRGAHPSQPLPLFNGSFYSPQMIHPQQLQQQHQQQQTNSQSKQMQQNTSMSSGSSSSHKHLQNQQKRSQGHAAVNGNNGNGNVHNFPVSKSHTSQSQQHLQSQNIIPPPQARHIENELGGGDSPSTADSRARPPVNAYNQSYMMQIHHSNFGMMATSPATMGVVSAAPTSSSGNQNDKRQQQQHSLKTGLESMMPQNFTMPFAPLSSGASAPGIDMSSVAHNHAIFQSLPEAARQNFQMVAAAAVAASQQKKNYREEVRGGAGSGDPMTAAAADERKVLQGKTSPAHPAGFRQSMAFSGSDGTDVSASKMAATTNVMDTSRASMSPAWTARAVMPCSPGSVISNAQLHAQYQQQMVQQLQKQQQQLGTSVTRTKAPTTISNGTAEYLTSSVATGGVKFSNTISAFPQNLVQISGNTSSSPTHSSPQWKASAARASTSQAAQTSSLVSASSSHKNHTQQQQQMRMQQNHTQISFGTNHKSTVQGQHHPPPSSSNQSQSSTMMAGSPTTSSISKGASGSSPRRANSVSMSNKNDQAPTMAPQQGGKASVQQIANQKSSSPAGGRSAPSILGNQQHMPTTSGSGSKSQMQQQHLQKSVAQQSQLFFSGSYGQSQSTSTGSASATSGYFAQRRRPEQQQQHPLSSTGPPTSPTGMLNMCPVSLGGGTISNPGKSNAATAAASTNLRGISLPPQQALHAAQFSSQSSGNQHHILPAGFSYVQQHPSAASVKPTEQKQPAGNDSLHACWQLDKG